MLASTAGVPWIKLCVEYAALAKALCLVKVGYIQMNTALFRPAPYFRTKGAYSTANAGTLSRRPALNVIVMWCALAAAACGKSTTPNHAIADSIEQGKVGEAYGHAVAALPDWNGNWLMTGGQTERARGMFDADHVYEPPDPAGPHGGFDFGPRAGSYDIGIPYNPEYKKKYEEIIKGELEGRDPDPVGGCMQPHGMPRQMAGIPFGPEVLMAPDMVLMSWPYLGAQRRIYTDGRPHPDPAKFAANYLGHSIGHWEGDTLLVDTVGILPGMYDQSGAPFSEKIHVTERIRLVDKDLLEDEMTIEDPVMLTGPWHVTRRYKRSNPRYANFSVEYCGPGAAVDLSKGYQEVVLPSEMEKKRNSSKP
jgi:hypothetical protein